MPCHSPAPAFPHPPTTGETGTAGLAHALEMARGSLDPLTHHERNQLANTCTLRGLELLTAGHDDALAEALECFNQAIALRRDLPLDPNPWYRWGLTAGLMNRGEALFRLGQREAALLAYEEAIRHLEKLPLESEPIFTWRLGLAWMQRALVLQELPGPEAQQQVLTSFQRGLHALEAQAAAGSAMHRVTRGCCRVNLAAWRLQNPTAASAALAAQEALCALDDLRPNETQDAGTAHAALQARHHYCQAVAWLLEHPPVDAAQADEWILQASDLVEEALTLAPHRQGSREAEDVAVQLFHFGCRIYLAYQPQFLAEFIEDTVEHSRSLPAAGVLRNAAVEALALAGDVLRKRGPASLGLTRLDDLLNLLAGLKKLALKLQQEGAHAPS